MRHSTEIATTRTEQLQIMAAKGASVAVLALATFISTQAKAHSGSDGGVPDCGPGVSPMPPPRPPMDAGVAPFTKVNLPTGGCSDPCAKTRTSTPTPTKKTVKVRIKAKPKRVAKAPEPKKPEVEELPHFDLTGYPARIEFLCNLLRHWGNVPVSVNMLSILKDLNFNPEDFSFSGEQTSPALHDHVDLTAISKNQSDPKRGDFYKYISKRPHILNEYEGVQTCTLERTVPPVASQYPSTKADNAVTVDLLVGNVNGTILAQFADGGRSLEVDGVNAWTCRNYHESAANHDFGEEMVARGGATASKKHGRTKLVCWNQKEKEIWEATVNDRKLDDTRPEVRAHIMRRSQR